MRGPDEQTSARFSDLSPEPRVRAAPPLRAIRRRTDEAVATLSPRLAALERGRPSRPKAQSPKPRASRPTRYSFSGLLVPRNRDDLHKSRSAAPGWPGAKSELIGHK